jgi:tetratricopeptide (TPR) repeat protein
VAVWRLLAARSRTGIETVRRPDTPYVGRGEELAQLRRLFERTLAERAAQLVTIVGEPGVGKSRFVAELAAFVDARPDFVVWRQGRCLPYGEGITFWALGEVVKAEAGILESDDPAQVAAKLQAAVAALLPASSEAEWLRARLAPLVGVAGPEATRPERTELFAAWRRFIEAMAATHPLVLVVEDLHWADPAMLEFLEHLADHSTGLPLLLVTTARPELLERHPGWGDGRPNASRIRLPSLSDAETATLVAALVGRSVLPAEVQALLLERAGGNPLYAEEFARLLADRELLAGGRLAAPEVPVPETVQGLIAARLDALTPRTRALLLDAAVVGRVFWPGAVAVMGGGAGDVEGGLRELERKRLVHRASASSVQHQDEYVFWHALVRDVAYAQIPRAGRARRHRKAADRRGLGQVAMWLRASTLALLLDLGRWDEALALADEAISWDRARRGDYLGVGCQRYASLVLLWRGELAAARDLATEVLPKAREIDDLQQLVPALVNAALIEQASGDHAAALALAQEAVQVTADRAGGHRFRGQHLADLVRLTAEGAPSLARGLVEQAQPTATRYRLTALTARAVLAEAAGDAERAAGLFAEAADGWKAYGQVLEHGRALLGAGRCLARLDRPEGPSTLREAHALFTRLGARPLATEAGTLLRHALPRSG